MKGLLLFLRETWWVFGTVAVLSVVAGYVTGVWIYYVFPIAIVPMVLYMSAVRYDGDGNLREDKRR